MSESTDETLDETVTELSPSQPPAALPTPPPESPTLEDAATDGDPIAVDELVPWPGPDDAAHTDGTPSPDERLPFISARRGEFVSPPRGEERPFISPRYVDPPPPPQKRWRASRAVLCVDPTTGKRVRREAGEDLSDLSDKVLTNLVKRGLAELG